MEKVEVVLTAKGFGKGGGEVIFCDVSMALAHELAQVAGNDGVERHRNLTIARGKESDVMPFFFQTGAKQIENQLDAAIIGRWNGGPEWGNLGYAHKKWWV